MTQPPLNEHDELEQYLRSELRDFAPEAPDLLWTGIEAQLPRRRRRLIFFWWWLTGGITVGLLTGMTYSYNSEQPIALSTTTIKSSINYEQSQNTTATVETSAVTLTNLPASNEPESVKEKGANPLKPSRKHDAEILSVQVISEKFRSIANQPATIPLTLPTVVSLPYLKPSLLDCRKKTELEFFTQVPRIQPVRARNWQINAIAGPVWQWQQPVTGAPGHTNQLVFAEYSEGPATGWQAGLSVRFAVRPNWQISSGLWRRTTQQISSHTAELRLMDGVCLNPYDTGSKVYEFQYGLHSSGNESNLTVRIAQVDSMSAMPADEPFLLTMRTSRQRTDWMLPLALRRTFGRGRWQGFMEGGGTLNVPGNISIEVDHFSEMCEDLCFEANHMPTLTSRERGGVSFSWMLSAGVDYSLGRNWSLQASPMLFGQKKQLGLSLHTGVSLKF